MGMKFDGNRSGESIGGGIFRKFPRIRKLEFPNFKLLYLSHLCTDSGVRICKLLRETRTSLWNWKFPDRNNFLKIFPLKDRRFGTVPKIPNGHSNGHISAIYEPNMVMFIFKLRRISRAIQWKGIEVDTT